MLLHWASSEGFKLKSILDIVWQSFQTHHYTITAAIQHCRSHSVSRFEYKVNLTLARFNGGRFYYRMIYIWPQSRRAALGEDGIMMQWDTVPPPVDLQAHGTWPLNYLRALQQSAIQTYIYSATQPHPQQDRQLNSVPPSIQSNHLLLTTAPLLWSPRTSSNTLAQ